MWPPWSAEEPLNCKCRIKLCHGRPSMLILIKSSKVSSLRLDRQSLFILLIALKLRSTMALLSGNTRSMHTNSTKFGNISLYWDRSSDHTVFLDGVAIKLSKVQSVITPSSNTLLSNRRQRKCFTARDTSATRKAARSTRSVGHRFMSRRQTALKIPIVNHQNDCECISQ